MVHRVQSESISAPLYEVRAASTAAGGSALTNAASLITIPKGSDWVSVTPRNFATAVVAQVALNPRLVILQTTDNLATLDNLTDLSDEAQDGDSTDIDLGTPFGGANDYIYVGALIPFRGCRVTEGTTDNVAAATLTVEYSTGTTTWIDISATDGTAGAQTLDQTGNVTWTVPTGWKATKLSEAVSGAIRHRLTDPQLYWTRWSWDIALTDSTDIVGIQSLNRSTAYMELLSGQSYEQKIVSDGVACVEALTNAGTANLVVNVGAQWGERFE